MLLLLALLFMVAVAIGTYVARSVAAAMLSAEREQPAVGAAHTRL
jgi:hypothetical protein